MSNCNLNPMDDSTLENTFGSFDWESDGESAIRIVDNWVSKNIVSVNIPQLRFCKTDGTNRLFSGDVNFHRLAIPQLTAFFKEVSISGLTPYLLTWGGSFVPRRKRGSGTLSRHSYGIAFDLNVEWNSFGDAPAKKGEQGSLEPLVPVAEKYGFCWGGCWKHPDGMHFEVAKILDISTKQDEVYPLIKIVITKKGKEGYSVVSGYTVGGVSYAKLKDLSDAIGDTSTNSAIYPVAQYLRSHNYNVYWNDIEKKVYAYEK